MSFTPAIPADGQSLGNSKPQVRGNFTYFSNTLALNHFATNSANAGKHQFVEMPVIAARPTIIASEGGLYTKNVTSNIGPTTSPELFWSVNVGGPEYQVTARSTNVTLMAAQSGWTFLPGGLLLQWGLATGVSTGGTSQSFAINFASGTFGPIITTSVASGSANVGVIVVPVDNTKFTLKTVTAGATTIHWHAIGQA